MFLVYTHSKPRRKKKPRKSEAVKFEKYKHEFKPLETKLFENLFYRNSTRDIPSLQPDGPIKQKPLDRYDGDMAERERLAQIEIEKKKKRVAPHFNKGAYQYITDEGIVRDLGKKV